jgi:hypothetical protein
VPHDQRETPQHRSGASAFRGKVPHSPEAYAGAAFNATGHGTLLFVDDYHSEG